METREEVEKLKENWMKDPCWDIEDTEGFKEYHDELLDFRHAAELEWQSKAEERIARRARVIAIDTGIVNSTVAQALCTYQEIEDQAAKQTARDLTVTTAVMAELQHAQIRATLLLAAQIQRVADAIEERSETEKAESNLDFMTKLYKVE